MNFNSKLNEEDLFTEETIQYKHYRIKINDYIKKTENLIWNIIEYVL
jgi:hypothetical protein